MRKPDLTYEKLVLVCVNEREEKDCCKTRGGTEIFMELKQALRQAAPSVRVSRTGCLGNCLSGPSVVIMPDNIWLGEVALEDVPQILEMIAPNKRTPLKKTRCANCSCC